MVFRNATVVMLLTVLGMGEPRAQGKAPPAADAEAEPAEATAGGTRTGSGATKSVDRLAPSINFDRMSYAEGLPNPQVKAVIQGKLGFIWLGTGDGLARYDGARMRVYHHDAADPTTADRQVHLPRQRPRSRSARR